MGLKLYSLGGTPMFKQGQIRKFLLISVGFGVVIGLIFPLFASIFTEYKSAELKTLFIISCIAAGIMVGVASYIVANFTLIASLKTLSAFSDD